MISSVSTHALLRESRMVRMVWLTLKSCGNFATRTYGYVMDESICARILMYTADTPSYTYMGTHVMSFRCGTLVVTSVHLASADTV